jgi:uncharacterized protein with FMN-binding domain
LSITPPQLGSGVGFGATAASAATLNQNTNTSSINSNNNVPNSNVVTASPSATANASSTNSKKSTAKKNSNSSSAKNGSVASPSASPSNSTSSAPNINGAFTGDAVNVGYGIVQVKITVANGKITDAVALQSPNGRSQRFSDYALPNLRSQTLAAQSAAIQGASGASYTSYGWYKSLISALQKAGMKTGV